MLAKFSIGKRIMAGFLLIVGLAAVTGATGYLGIRTVGNSLHQVGQEEAPLVDLSLEMMLVVKDAVTAMDEYMAATSVLGNKDADALDGIAAEYQKAIEAFDVRAEAIVAGGELEGRVIIPTDNPELAAKVADSDRLHNEEFAPAAARLMADGKALVELAGRRDEAMDVCETVFDNVIEGAGRLEEMVAGGMRERARRANVSGEALAILTEDVPVVDMVLDIKVSMAETRIVIEDFVQQRDLETLAGLRGEYAGRVADFDACVSAILQGGTVGDVVVTKTSDPDVIAAIEDLDARHGRFQAQAVALMDAHEEMIRSSQQVNEAMARLDVAAGHAIVALEAIEAAASGEMDAAREVGVHAVTRSTAAMIGIVAAALVLGVLIGVVVTRSVTGPLNRAIGSLRQGAEQIASAASQVAGARHEIAESATSQAANLEESSAAMEEMSATVRQNSEAAERSSEVARDVLDRVQTGSEAMERMAATINDIKVSSDDTARIIRTIDEIAFQTNLLALNAAVEAARAGDSGRGFAVVAEEVRNLAQRSATAAQETSALIQSARQHAEDGVRESAEVGEILSSIIDAVGEMDELVGRVASANKEQTRGIVEVNQALTHVDSITQGNAAASEETASASEELSAQAGEMQNLVFTLRQVVEGTGVKAEGGAGAPVARRRSMLQPERAPAAAQVDAACDDEAFAELMNF